MDELFFLAPLGLIFAYWFYRDVVKWNAERDSMTEEEKAKEQDDMAW